MKAVWKGDIAFGLVSIPVGVYSASEPRYIQFHLLHKKDNTRLRYKRWCDKDKREVSWKDTVRGMEYAKGKYFVLTPEELEKLKPKRTSTIEIKGFTEKEHIDELYFEKHYFVAPQRQKEKAFFLLKEVLAQNAKAAIGAVVMHEREYLCLIENYKSGLLMTTLNYSNEVRDIADIELLKTKPALTKEEIKFANDFVDKLTIKQLDLSKFKETFAEELKDLIKKKVSGKEIKAEKKKKPNLNLMEALKANAKK